MRITLHDNILSGAGTAQPSARAPITDAARARWVKAMDARLRGAPRAADPFTTDFDTGAWGRRARVARRGAALLAAWSEGGGGRVLVASVLLAGEDGADDDASLAAPCAA